MITRAAAVNQPHVSSHHPQPAARSADLKVWDLHTYPTDDWYDRAKKATDRCAGNELTMQVQGAKNGMDDKVRGEKGLGFR